MFSSISTRRLILIYCHILYAIPFIVSESSSPTLSISATLRTPSGYSSRTYHVSAVSTYLPTSTSPMKDCFPLGSDWPNLYGSNYKYCAVKDEGRGPSIWDFLPHRQLGTIADNTTGDVSSSHYYLYKQDFARLKALGIPYNSTSISWPRLFPFRKGPVNIQVVAHYDGIIMEQDTPLTLFNEFEAWTDSAGLPACATASFTTPDGFPVGSAADPGSVSRLRSTPTGIRKFLTWRGRTSGTRPALWDLRRADYLQGYLDNILATTVKDGINVTGAFAWAIFDKIEWFSKKRVRFGLQSPKASMFQLLDWFGLLGGAKL
ncbi:glycoside hydrolase family 1 protein [Glonium stellatum]|uniref:Glycoside hydrolase family 1 protein n=1 Tax=Glonium stellatum TaxID=574774 RepID=A0A8E2F9Q4_9PEZI|nr:glycoside hydrolase family 1 protein [Glonium stellatum]